MKPSITTFIHLSILSLSPSLPLSTATLTTRQLLVPNLGSLTLTCGACSELTPDHATCVACTADTTSLATDCTEPISIPCSRLQTWLEDHAPADEDVGITTPLDRLVLNCEKCGATNPGTSSCTMCQGRPFQCSASYSVECEEGEDQGLGDLLDMAVPVVLAMGLEPR